MIQITHTHRAGGSERVTFSPQRLLVSPKPVTLTEIKRRCTANFIGKSKLKECLIKLIGIRNLEKKLNRIIGLKGALKNMFEI